LNKNSGDDTLNPVLCASVCWIFRTHDPPVFKPRPTTPPQYFKPDWHFCLQEQYLQYLGYS